jgi:hypothetical protein
LSITDTTVCDGADGIAGLTPSDCVGFYKADGGATLAIVVKRDSVVVCNSTVPATISSDTYYWAAFEVSMSDTAGTGSVTAWLMHGSTGSIIASTGAVTSTTMPYDGEEFLAETLALVSGTASGTITASIDCIGTLIDRAA